MRDCVTALQAGRLSPASCLHCHARECECEFIDPAKRPRYGLLQHGNRRNGVAILEHDDLYWLYQAMKTAGYHWRARVPPEPQPPARAKTMTIGEYRENASRWGWPPAREHVKRAACQWAYKSSAPLAYLASRAGITHPGLYSIVTGDRASPAEDSALETFLIGIGALG